MDWDLNYEFDILMDIQDNKEPVRLYKIKFWRLAFPKLVLAWKIEFRVSKFEGVLQNE